MMATGLDTATQLSGGRRGHLSMGLVAAVAALGGLLFGYDTGIISSALPVLSKEFGIANNDGAQQLVVSAILVGCIIGAFISGPISDRIGRRRVLGGVAILFILAAAAVSISQGWEILMAFRVFLGIAVGAASQVVPVYIAELAPSSRRGQLVVMFQAAVILGILISSVSGYFIGARDGGWRITAVLGAIPALVLLIGCFALPESPRFLVLIGRTADAQRVLAHVRPDGTDVAAEVAEIVRVEEETKSQRGGWKEVAAKRVRPALAVGIGIAVLCQITGINTVLYYAPTILGKVGFDLNAGLLAGMSVTILLFIFTLLGLFLVDRWGRRKLLLAFVPISAICVIALGFCFSGDQTVGPPILLVILLVAFTAFNGGSLSVVAWLIAAEVYPLRIRGKAMGLTALMLWAADLLVSLTSLSLTSALGPRGIFWLFGGIAVVAFVFIYFRVPETKGRSLEKIEESLNEGTFYPNSRAVKR
jgi:major inositol transporter-like SP family MFS transporter